VAVSKQSTWTTRKARKSRQLVAQRRTRSLDHNRNYERDFSNLKGDDLVEATYDGNDVLLGKFIQDFNAPTPVLMTPTVVWNGRKAWFPLSRAALPNAVVQAIASGNADLGNEPCDAD
jgi:hypothetical protein